MSTSERAPEPTMEEILASIRRIISEDETASAAPSTASEPHPDDESLELVEEEADDKIIDDIARVLSAGASQPAEAGEEDILDLTAELGGLEPVDEEPLPLEAAAEPEDEAVFEVDEPVVDLEAVALELVEPEPAEEEPEPEPEAEAQAEPVQREPEPSPPPRQLSASEEAASALERAIAALRAGQVPTSPQFGTSAPPPPFSSEPAVGQQTPPEPAATFSAPDPEPALEPVLTVTETVEHTVVVTETAPDESEEAEEPDYTGGVGGFWPAPEAALVAVKTNGSTPHEPRSEDAASPRAMGSAKTLEDSVKDMLRPMLKQWLEENMTRVLTTALQDELRNDPARFQRD
jgi:cell pole-organizing protein PopZ